MESQKKPVVSARLISISFSIVLIGVAVLVLLATWTTNEHTKMIEKEDIPSLEKDFSIGLGDSLYSDKFTLTGMNAGSLSFERSSDVNRTSIYTVPAKKNTTFTLPIHETRYTFHIVEIRKERNEVRLRVTKETVSQ